MVDNKKIKIKKIKNLTLKEAKKLCDQYVGEEENYGCNKCPYGVKVLHECKLSISNLDYYGDEKIEIEIN